MSGMILEVLVLGLFPAAMTFAAASDLVTMTISNRLALVLAASFFLLAVLIGMPAAEIGRHVMASAVVLAAAFVCFACGWIGGGDAKLAAATALWLGFSHLLDYLLMAALFGGVLTFILLELRRWPLPDPLAKQRWIVRLHSMGAGIPYGIALALAGLMVYPDTDFIRALAFTN
jgi:prepilin peptidase CpaA